MLSVESMGGGCRVGWVGFQGSGCRVQGSGLAMSLAAFSFEKNSWESV